MKLLSVKRKLRKNVAACHVTPSMATRSLTVDVAVKWRFSSRKRVACFSSIHFITVFSQEVP